MEVIEFNELELKGGDIIDIVYSDGSSERRLLLRDTAVPPVEERRTYPDNKIVPAIPAKIVVQNKQNGMEEGIELSHIKTVTRIANVNK